MKIVEDSPTKLVLKEGALRNRIIGVIFMIAGIALIVGGSKAAHSSAALYVFGGIFALVGIAVAVFSKSDIVVADKTNRQLTVTFKSLKNRQGQNQQCSFDDVQSVQLFQQYHQQYVTGGPNNVGGSTQTTLQMNLAVVLKNGTQWTIANEQHNAAMGVGISTRSLSTRGQKLADALGVPFQESGTPTLGQVVQTVEQKLTGQGESFSGQPPAPPAAPMAPSAPLPSVTPAATPPQAEQPLPPQQPPQTPVI